jgi:hypothetical protein
MAAALPVSSGALVQQEAEEQKGDAPAVLYDPIPPYAVYFGSQTRALRVLTLDEIRTKLSEMSADAPARKQARLAAARRAEQKSDEDDSDAADDSDEEAEDSEDLHDLPALDEDVVMHDAPALAAGSAAPRRIVSEEQVIMYSLTRRAGEKGAMDVAHACLDTFQEAGVGDPVYIGAFVMAWFLGQCKTEDAQGWEEDDSRLQTEARALLEAYMLSLEIDNLNIDEYVLYELLCGSDRRPVPSWQRRYAFIAGAWHQEHTQLLLRQNWIGDRYLYGCILDRVGSFVDGTDSRCQAVITDTARLINLLQLSFHDNPDHLVACFGQKLAVHRGQTVQTTAVLSELCDYYCKRAIHNRAVIEQLCTAVDQSAVYKTYQAETVWGVQPTSLETYQLLCRFFRLHGVRDPAQAVAVCAGKTLREGPPAPRASNSSSSSSGTLSSSSSSSSSSASSSSASSAAAEDPDDPSLGSIISLVTATATTALAGVRALTSQLQAEVRSEYDPLLDYPLYHADSGRCWSAKQLLRWFENEYINVSKAPGREFIVYPGTEERMLFNEFVSLLVVAMSAGIRPEQVLMRVGDSLHQWYMDIGSTAERSRWFDAYFWPTDIAGGGRMYRGVWLVLPEDEGKDDCTWCCDWHLTRKANGMVVDLHFDAFDKLLQSQEGASAGGVQPLTDEEWEPQRQRLLTDPRMERQRQLDGPPDAEDVNSMHDVLISYVRSVLVSTVNWIQSNTDLDTLTMLEREPRFLVSLLLRDPRSAVASIQAKWAKDCFARLEGQDWPSDDSFCRLRDDFYAQRASWTEAELQLAVVACFCSVASFFVTHQVYSDAYNKEVAAHNINILRPNHLQLALQVLVPRSMFLSTTLWQRVMTVSGGNKDVMQSLCNTIVDYLWKRLLTTAQRADREPAFFDTFNSLMDLLPPMLSERLSPTPLTVLPPGAQDSDWLRMQQHRAFVDKAAKYEVAAQRMSDIQQQAGDDPAWRAALRLMESMWGCFTESTVPCTLCKYGEPPERCQAMCIDAHAHASAAGAGAAAAQQCRRPAREGRHTCLVHQSQEEAIAQARRPRGARRVDSVAEPRSRRRLFRDR